MAKQNTARSAADYIMPLYMNGLQGRMLRMPPPKNRPRELLLIYGHHASLERMFGLAEDLNQYGSITMPDLPGFGGMQPYYKIGVKPTLDNMADYLAAFVKLRYRHRRFSIVGMSFGFIVAVRMLQKYPEIANKVDLMFSVVGFAHRDDFKFKSRNYWLLRSAATIFSNRLPAWLASQLALRGPVIRFSYKLVEGRHSKLKDADAAERQRRINFEITLWQINDFRTYCETSLSMFKLDLTQDHVDMPVYHVAVTDDRYFDNLKVEQHLRTIFSDFTVAEAKMQAHAPTVIADAKDAAPFIPKKYRTMLRKKPKARYTK